jgi:hypothetical protein
MFSSTKKKTMVDDVFLARLNENLACMEASEREAILALLRNIDSLDVYNDVDSGERKLLGQLLVLTGKVNQEQIDLALQEQVQTGEQLGDLLLRKGMLNKVELDALLSYQSSQKKSKLTNNSPLKLGSLLVATGLITTTQRDMALELQKRTRQRLGDVLVNMGIIKPVHLRCMLSLQTVLFTASVGLMTYSVSPEAIETASAGMAVPSDDTSYSMLIDTPASADIQQDYIEPVTELRVVTPPGADEQYKLGMQYLQGKGVEKCEITAKKFFSAAAQQGHTGSQYQLGMILWDNDEDDEAMELFTRASEKGHELAKVAYYTLVEDADYGLGC